MSRHFPPSSVTLTNRELEVLIAALCPDRGLYWAPVNDRFEDSEGNCTRAGRAMRNAGFIRESPSSAVWLPKLRGFRDVPGRMYELTPKGHDLLRKRLGEDTYRLYRNKGAAT